MEPDTYQRRLRAARPAWRITLDDDLRVRRATTARIRSRRRWGDETGRPDQERRRARLTVLAGGG